MERKVNTPSRQKFGKKVRKSRQKSANQKAASKRPTWKKEIKNDQLWDKEKNGTKTKCLQLRLLADWLGPLFLETKLKYLHEVSVASGLFLCPGLFRLLVFRIGFQFLLFVIGHKLQSSELHAFSTFEFSLSTGKKKMFLGDVFNAPETAFSLFKMELILEMANEKWNFFLRERIGARAVAEKQRFGHLAIS